jgi:hypothetical protein
LTVVRADPRANDSTADSSNGRGRLRIVKVSWDRFFSRCGSTRGVVSHARWMRALGARLVNGRRSADDGVQESLAAVC